MDKLRNKNTIVLIISALLVLAAVIVAVVATASANSDKKEAEKTTTEESVSLDLEAIANMNSSNKKDDKTDDKADSKTEDKKEPVASDSASDSVTEKPATSNKTSSYSTGTYKVATKDDPLGMRIQPNSDADRILYIDKGAEVEVLAVWDDWGYVVHNGTGGWVSMSYLELVSGN